MSHAELSRVCDEDALRRWQLVSEASQDADFVGLPADPIEEIRPALSGHEAGDEIELLVGDVAEGPVAAVTVRRPTRDNRDLANVSIRVHPAHRRRGHGRAALQRVLTGVQAAGRSKVLVEVPTATCTANPSEGEAFATAVGARRMIAERRRMLDVEELSLTDLSAMRAEATAAAVGYSTVSWRDHTPADLVADMAGLRSLMSTDPPQGDLELEPERWDADRYLERERSYIERGRRHLSVAAREDRTGRLVGYTDLGVSAGGSSVGYQWDTIVRSEHRGHRLGMLIKLVNLDELRGQFPEVRYLNTWNADGNSYMISVNERLGFREMEGWSEWQLDL